MTEIQLIENIKEGSQEAFAMLYSQYSSNVYNTALSFTKNAEDAEEITQDVFVKIHKSVASFKGDSSLSTWIYRITVNTALNYQKKKKRFTLFKNSVPQSDTMDFEHPGVLLENKENAKELYKAIDRLSANQKMAFILSFVEGLPRQDVADAMGNSLKSVESLLQRAKKNMRVELEKSYPNRRKKK